MPLWKLEKGIHAGEILKLHGYSGSVRVAFLFSGLDRKLKAGSFLFIEWMEKPVPYLVNSIQWTTEDSAIISLADITSEGEAKPLAGRRILLPEDVLPKKKKSTEPGDILIGFSVVDETGNSLGEVIEFYETGAQNLLEIRGGSGEFLMPYHPDFVIKEDRKKKQLIVRLPEGMIDLSEAETA